MHRQNYITTVFAVLNICNCKRPDATTRFRSSKRERQFRRGKVSTAEDNYKVCCKVQICSLRSVFLCLRLDICVSVFASTDLCFCVYKCRSVFLCLQLHICVSAFLCFQLYNVNLCFCVCRCRSEFLCLRVQICVSGEICVSAFASADPCFCICSCKAVSLCLQVQICVSAFASADPSFCVCRHRPVYGYADADTHFATTEVCSCNSGTVAATAKYTL